MIKTYVVFPTRVGVNLSAAERWQYNTVFPTRVGVNQGDA